MLNIGYQAMPDGRCTCEVWVDERTGRAYAVTCFPHDGVYIPVTYAQGKIAPIDVGGGYVASFATEGEARTFLLDYVAKAGQ